MGLIHSYCRTDFSSYEDFYKNFTLNIPADFNFGFDVVDRLAKEKPDKTALVWCNDQGDEKIISFGEVSRMSNKMANALVSLGVKKGDAVMVMLKSRYEYWYIAVAAHKLGAVLIPATHMLTTKDLVYRINAAKIKMILTLDFGALFDQLDEAQTQTGDILQVKGLISGKREGYVDFIGLTENSSDAFSRPGGLNSRDIMMMYFTSGTTGMPKMVPHDFYYPLGHILTARFWHGLDENDLHVSVADTGWAKNSWGNLYGQWICEAAVFVYDYSTRFIPSDYLKLIDKYKITSFCAPPTIYRFFIKEDLSGFSLASLKKCTTAGEPLNPEVYNRWMDFTGIPLREGFGQTESVILVGNTVWTTPRPGSTGMIMPRTNCRVLDEDGNVCEAGEEGELCVLVLDVNNRPPGLFMGYYENNALDTKAMDGGVYHTGDTVWQDEDGYIWFKGRNDDIIKCSGYRIGPFEVESALLEHPAVLESAITAVPDPDRGFNVKATVVLTKKFQPSEELKRELQDHVKKVTAPYKYPRIIEFVDELPKTISGKTKRAQIRETDSK
jgi:acetyl-CoA synthetase